MNERPKNKPNHQKMKEILEKILTEKAARDSSAVTTLAVSQEEFDSWN